MEHYDLDLNTALSNSYFFPHVIKGFRELLSTCRSKTAQFQLQHRQKEKITLAVLLGVTTGLNKHCMWQRS